MFSINMISGKRIGQHHVQQQQPNCIYIFIWYFKISSAFSKRFKSEYDWQLKYKNPTLYHDMVIW